MGGELGGDQLSGEVLLDAEFGEHEWELPVQGAIVSGEAGKIELSVFFGEDEEIWSEGSGERGKPRFCEGVTEAIFDGFTARGPESSSGDFVDGGEFPEDGWCGIASEEHAIAEGVFALELTAAVADRGDGVEAGLIHGHLPCID